LVDHERGIIVRSPNFPRQFKQVALSKELSKHFKLPVLVDNDANCFAIGEAVYGAGKKLSHVVGLTLGTGIGGGIVIDGKVYRGKHGSAGELGHMTIRDGGITCSCGQHGHLEAYASGTVITSHYRAFTRETRTASEIISLAAKRNEAASQVIAVARQALAVGFASIINTLNPDIIVIGGGLGSARSYVAPAITAAKKLVVYPELARTPIVHAQLGDTAALLGAAALFSN
jgi:glucokinase